MIDEDDLKMLLKSTESWIESEEGKEKLKKAVEREIGKVYGGRVYLGKLRTNQIG